MYESKKEELVTREQRIRILEEEVARLNRLTSTVIPFNEITEEMHINYEGIKEIIYSNEVKTNFIKVDTIPVFSIKWNDSISSEQKAKEFNKIQQWLKLKLNSKKMNIKQLD